MRVAKWRAKEVLTEVFDQATDNANQVMDEVAMWARYFCPIGTVTRPGGWSFAHVEFTPRTGKNRGTPVRFDTEKRWKGREPGNLRDTIRRVNKSGAGNVRVYAGSYKIYWAHMVERGFHDRAGKWHPGVHFLQRAFNGKKKDFARRIQEGR